MRKLFVIFLLTLIAETLPAQLLHFHQLTVKDGLPHNSIIALGQDKQGNLWLATSSGMCRYDGEKFEMISTRSLTSVLTASTAPKTVRYGCNATNITTRYHAMTPRLGSLSPMTPCRLPILFANRLYCLWTAPLKIPILNAPGPWRNATSWREMLHILARWLLMQGWWTRQSSLSYSTSRVFYGLAPPITACSSQIHDSNTTNDW